MESIWPITTVHELLGLLAEPQALRRPHEYFGAPRVLTAQTRELEQIPEVVLYRGTKGLSLIGFREHAYVNFLSLLLPGRHDFTPDLARRLPSPALLVQENGTMPQSTSRPAIRYGAVVLVPWATLRHHLRPWLHGKHGSGGAKVVRKLHKSKTKVAYNAGVLPLDQSFISPPTRSWKKAARGQKKVLAELEDLFDLRMILPSQLPSSTELEAYAADGKSAFALLDEHTADITLWLLIDDGGERFLVFGPSFALERERKIKTQLSRYDLPRIPIGILRKAHALSPLTQQDILGHGLALITAHDRDVATLMKYEQFVAMLQP